MENPARSRRTAAGREKQHPEDRRGEHYFPYRELAKLRRHISEVKMCYREGASIPPPLFFYPTPGQLEILDGVHRCLAAYALWEEAGLNVPYRVWVGFDHTMIEAGVLVQQLWLHGLHTGATKKSRSR